MSLFRSLLPLSYALLVAHSADARLWKDVQGKTMDAELIQVVDGSAQLKKPDGMRFSFPIAKLSKEDQDYLKTLETAKDESTQAEIPELEATDLTTWLEQNLVSVKTERVARDKGSRIPQAEYIAFYFSSSWCPPCKKFTPKLVDFYNEHSTAHGNFEIIFVSSDHGKEAMEKHMIDYKMPWSAVEYGESKDRTVQKFSGKGIPCLVIANRQGDILHHTYVDGKYKGPAGVLKKLDQLLDPKKSFSLRRRE